MWQRYIGIAPYRLGISCTYLEISAKPTLHNRKWKACLHHLPPPCSSKSHYPPKLLMPAPAHHPVNSLIDLHTTRTEKVLNKSGKYFVKCNHCSVDPFIHRDNKVLNHLQLCPGASQDLKNEVLRALMEKGRVANAPTVVVVESGDDEPTPSAEQPQTSRQSGKAASGAQKKRKSNSGIAQYFMPPLTEKETNEANVTLLR